MTAPMFLSLKCLTNARDDAKAGAAAADDGERPAASAAFDEARTALYELLHEGPKLTDRDREALTFDLRQFDEALKLVRLGKLKCAAYVADRIVGSLTRVADRWK
ncbi:hypothetical protein [Mycolicibacterium fortuitum]|uniref:hypothetical protein n=1 Tax=Mycolicibacterium fortuitum TaxID=1766 RepID=UPI001C10E38A